MIEGSLTLVDTELVDSYTALGDPLMSLLADSSFTTERWLRESVVRRAVYWTLYGDLLTQRRGARVLDVGGGLAATTQELARRHDYLLVDLLAHDDVAETGLPADSFLCEDWHDAPLAGFWDIVIANDLFPNVDQRLEAFVNRFVPEASELRLLLTYYNQARFYRTRRVDADEILTMLAWDGAFVRLALERVAPRLALHVLEQPRPSLFPNGRELAIVVLRNPRLACGGASPAPDSDD